MKSDNMKQLLTLILFLLLSCSAFAQSEIYIQTGNVITKLNDVDPNKINAIEWQIRLYKNGMPKDDNSLWGQIKGSTADEVLSKLEKQKKFELDFNEFIGKGRVQDEICTHFNSLGPIAIMEDITENESPLEEAQNKLAESFAKAVDLYNMTIEAHGYLDVIINGTDNPYTDVGNNFQQYADGLKDAILQIKSLQNVLINATDNLLQNINKKLDEIDIKLEKIRSQQDLSNDGNSDAIEATLNKELQKATNNNIQSQSSAKDNTYYAYLSVSFNVPAEDYYPSGIRATKRLIFISEPISCTGNADNIKEKVSQFISKVYTQYPDSSAIGFSDIDCTVHNGQSSDDWMETLDECKLEIEKLKKRISDGWGGDHKRFEIVEIK